MNFSADNTILITGGASGIGFTLAEHFLKASKDNKVIICGRNEKKLAVAREKYPSLITKVCNLKNPQERIELHQWIITNFSSINILVNNAGIQRRPNLLSINEEWQNTAEEIDINLSAPIHLSTLFIPHLLKRERASIINVTSGLAFTPLANVPIYCATKAALRSFTLSLRFQLRNTSIKVIEIIPPAVNTDLGGEGLHTFGVPLQEFGDIVWGQLNSGSLEIVHEYSAQVTKASPKELAEIFNRMNSNPKN